MMTRRLRQDLHRGGLRAERMMLEEQVFLQAQALAGEGDWEEASRLSREAFQLWQDHEFYLHVLMRHSDTDGILRAFRALEQYLALEESDQYTAANADLIAQLELLSEMEQPSWENIL